MCKEKKNCICSCKKNLKESPELLQEKIDLKLNSTNKVKLLEQLKIANDALYEVYNLCDKNNLNKDSFLKILDESVSNVDHLTTILVVQNTKNNK